MPEREVSLGRFTLEMAEQEIARLNALLEDERSRRFHAEAAVQEKDSMFMEEWMRAERFNDFWNWVEHGERKGWCTGPVCATHDGIPGTDEENEEEGEDDEI